MNNRVKELRVAQGLTQQQLACAVHVSSRTIISIEKGRYNPSLLLAYRLALALGTPMTELYCLAENLRREDGEESDGRQRT
ncbi:transcriptional regulator, XRE family [Coriobacterium glomerans PW2]|uniref:Transcriptional regulator, XRE family n=1 Tax=Coriobacterium glomerans (strain ATCC 49209 / DSM 20642 / JCM 10262 / PW2) TaxID=700015 RepID=F2NA34_CORGP|nr:helix-turn-helix domain-containing protein [Coriobacterium glomerans]AEB06428.1 transcriptional regulator, XRE family [Coriobacterium glomerans PW2]